VTVTLILAPMAARFDRVPSSLSLSQRLVLPGLEREHSDNYRQGKRPPSRCKCPERHRIQIGKGDAVALLQMASGQLPSWTSWKNLPSAFRNIRFGTNMVSFRGARPQVEVKPAVVIEVAEIAPHGHAHSIQVRRHGHVGEGAS